MDTLLKANISKGRKKELRKLLIFFDEVSAVDRHEINWNLQYGVLGIILPVSKKFDQKVDDLFEKKQAEGFVVPKKKLEKNERVARMLVYYGYLFLVHRIRRTRRCDISLSRPWIFHSFRR